MSTDGEFGAQPGSDTDKPVLAPSPTPSPIEIESNVIKGFMIGFGAILGMRNADMNNVPRQSNIMRIILSTINIMLRPHGQAFNPNIHYDHTKHSKQLNDVLCNIYKLYQEHRSLLSKIAKDTRIDVLINEEEKFRFLEIGCLALKHMHNMFPQLQEPYAECEQYFNYLILPGAECFTKILLPVIRELQPKLLEFKICLFKNKIVVDISNINSSRLVDFTSLEDFLDDAMPGLNVVIGKFDFSTSHYAALMTIFDMLANKQLGKLDILCLEKDFDPSMVCAILAKAKELNATGVSVLHSQAYRLRSIVYMNEINMLHWQNIMQQKALHANTQLLRDQYSSKANQQKPTIMDGS